MKTYTVKVDKDGTESWYRNGKLHREDGPAVTLPCGTTMWLLKDRLHRVGGPAVERADGTKAWYLDGACTTKAAVMGKR